MKLLIAYDGSKDADSAIDDLHFCGLPSHGTAEVIAVAEVWLPPPGSLDPNEEQPPAYVEEIIHDWRQKSEKAVAEAEMLARFASSRVKTALPNWAVTSLASYGSPAWEIVSESEKLNADLILVGAQGHSFLSRLVLGSISQRVLTEARCSVRIGRGRIEVDTGPARIVVGFDGSLGARAAVAAVADRNWPEGTEVMLITASEPVVPTAIGRYVPPVERPVEEIAAAETVVVHGSGLAAIETLKSCGLRASLRTIAGNPKHVLPFEAEKWGADSIFVGANAWGSRVERFLIGSTSAAVASRAHCSVEVVRSAGSEESSRKSQEPNQKFTGVKFRRGESR